MGYLKHIDHRRVSNERLLARISHTEHIHFFDLVIFLLLLTSPMGLKAPVGTTYNRTKTTENMHLQVNVATYAYIKPGSCMFYVLYKTNISIASDKDSGFKIQLSNTANATRYNAEEVAP